MPDREQFQMRTALSLVASTCKRTRSFYEEWAEIADHMKELHHQFSDQLEVQKRLIVVMAKEAKSYTEVQAITDDVNYIRKILNRIEKLLLGPGEMARTGHDLVRTLEMAVKVEERLDELSGSDSGSRQSEGDRILELLTEDELAQVYAWVENRL